MKWNVIASFWFAGVSYFECSECKELVLINHGTDELEKLEFCPKCGEKVDKNEENKNE